MKKLLMIGCGIVAGGLLAGSYKFGAHRQAVADDKAFTDYLSFVEKQDLLECKDAIDQTVMIMNDKCTHQMAEQCPEIKAPDFDPLDPF